MFHTRTEAAEAVGLLTLRMAVGGMMLTHGWPKLGRLLQTPDQFANPLGLGPELSLGLAVFAEVICAALVVYYVALVSGYYMWDGGAATGPRHMLPAVPFLALGLVEAFRLAPRATAALSAISGVIMLAAADAGPEAPQHGVAIWEHAWVQLGRSGRAATADASNLGRFAGLPGPISLVPLIAAWIAAFAFFEPNPAAAPDR